jgi:hypothetical protein
MPPSEMYMITPEEMQSLSKALDAAKDYADSVVKGSLSELGGILSDTVGYWRLKNQIRLILKTKEWLEEKNIAPNKLLPDIFVPLLNDGGNVEDATLADMFASLLACHLDPEQQELVHPSYTKVLAQLSPVDATLMLEFRKFVSHKGAREVGLRGGGIIVLDIAEMTKLSYRSAYLSCLNLERLGIIEHVGYIAPGNHPMPNIFEDSMEHQKFRMTEYGIAFFDACHHRNTRSLPE